MDSKDSTVFFCGDRVMTALTHASVGVHIRNGLGTAWTAGDVVLTGPSLSWILIDLSRDS